jgi:glycosyltransferase involved in cell wall biosynthesis
MFIKIKELIVKRHINIIHNNSTSTVLNSLLGQLSTPVVTTVHTNFDSPSFIIPYHLFNQFKNFYYILIGKHQLQFIRENHIRLSKYHIIPNGLDISNIEPSYDSFDSNYMFWIGRVSSKHNKGLAEAVIAAKKTKKYLKAAITIEDQKFYDTKVKPNLSKYSKIMTTGLSPTLKFDAYRKAKFFIYPIMWEEPFGLVFLESMVTGTPVIAFARGATTEIIKDGLNGYLVNPKNKNNGEFITKKSGVDGVIEAIERIESLNKDEYQNMRIMARKTVEEKYSIRRMTTQYLKIYKKLSK